ELDQEKLANRVYSYTRETLRTLMKNNAVPDMIQIGNEVTFGMLWDTARVDVWESQWNTTSQWNYFCRLLSLASKACREVCPDAWVMIHSDRGGDEVSAVRFFNQMQVYNVDYDIIGISYYPFWHGPLRQLKDCMDGLRMNFPEKKVNIVEVAFPYHEWGIDQNASYEPEYPATPEGQKQFFIDFIKTIKQCSNVNGFMYWFPEETYSPEKEILKLYRGVFDNWTGKALQVMGVFAN
ncbi:MAG TPA: glycosyl hydrolase 53 family protein, partial [Bacteroidales bacterium]|nr:glycosyl hydrolase 53 family protein [Bacteroidales bacterium]